MLRQAGFQLTIFQTVYDYQCNIGFFLKVDFADFVTLAYCHMYFNLSKKGYTTISENVFI
jgi:hypothetical protein